MHSVRILAQAGLRPSISRTAVLDHFRDHPHQHCTAEEIFSRVNDSFGNVSMASVYRALNQLVDAKLLSTFSVPGGRFVYELNDDRPHDHFFCTTCRQIIEFSDGELNNRLEATAAQHDFEPSQRQILVLGTCAECIGKSDAARKA